VSAPLLVEALLVNVSELVICPVDIPSTWCSGSGPTRASTL